MADPTKFRTLTLSGFRAYLQPKTFDLSKKPCLAIFAPNGLGKSSVIDALEFLFSEHGTLDRLGQRTFNNQAGPPALAHNGAQAAAVTPMVSFSTISGKTIVEGSRPAAGNQRPMHAAAAAMKQGFVVSPIIRGYTLRTFVENHSPENRYSDVASWLQLTPLVDAQKSLRTLRREVKAAAESTADEDRLTVQLRAETTQEVQAWDDNAVLAFVNGRVIAPLDPALKLTALTSEDPGYGELMKRLQNEENRIGLAGLKQIRNAVTALWQMTTPDDGSDPHPIGAIAAFDAALGTLASAKDIEEAERGKASGTIFRSVWKEAKALFAEEADAPKECPVCATEIGNTAAGSVSAIHDLLHGHLSDLQNYNDAKTALDTAEIATTRAHNLLIARLPTMIDHLPTSDESGLRTALIDYQAGIAGWPGAQAPTSTAIVAALDALMAKLDCDIAAIEENQGDHTWAKAKVKIDQLLRLMHEVLLAVQTKSELARLHDALVAQATLVSNKIREKVQSLLDTLQGPMNDIYKQVQGANAKPIRLELPGEDETNQQRMQLVIDFAENRTGVPPAGYLSDSQIHSVALALRLAAIKKFNLAAPFVALDDVVTSYDADHRRAIGALLARMFTDFQIIVVTHDERFFNYLKDQLASKDWQYARINGLDPEFGPRFADHKVTDEMIAHRWANGESAANEMRQAEEEWLLGIARGFGVNVRIRSLEKAYSYERAELASAIGGFLSGLKLAPANIPGVNNRFIDSLVKGEVENFGSHFQAGPYGDGSIGDEKTRWTEFTRFREQFECVCGRTKYQRPFGLNKPVCGHPKCETQFAFRPPTESAGSDDSIAVTSF